MGASENAKLVCTAGPSAGAEFTLESSEVIVGRGERAAIRIADRSVSREHLRVQRRASGWVARDLGSGNGTLLNGTRLAEDRSLHHRDLLTLGKTQIRFVQPSSSVSISTPGPTGLYRRIRRALGAAILCVLLLGGIGFKIFSARESARRDAERRSARAAWMSAFQTAKGLVREGKWDQALPHLEQIHREAPDLPGLQAYLDRSRIELPNQKLIALGWDALQRNELGAAADAVAKVTADTQLRQLESLKVALGEKLPRRLMDARAAIAAKKYDLAMAIVADARRAFPDDGGARTLEEEMRLALARKAKSEPSIRPWQPALDRYREGDVAGAISLANRCGAGVARCRVLAKSMAEILQLQRRLQKLERKELERLLALDRQVGAGKSSRMASAAMARLAGLYYKSAAAANAAGQWSRAMELARKTLQIEPSHRDAAELVEALRGRARELFLLAYSMKDAAPEEALAKMREVEAMTPAGDELHVKAATWREKLSR